jgi:hypothetical protein
MGKVAWGVIALALASGCAHKPPPAPIPYVKPQHQTERVRMAVLPVENDAYPKVAERINEAFKTARLRAVDDYFRSKVTLDVVQLSIECVDASPACYTAVGKSLNANVLLMAHIQKRPHGLRVVIKVFNVDTSSPLHQVDRVFRKQDEAVAVIPQLVAEATGETGSGAL